MVNLDEKLRTWKEKVSESKAELQSLQAILNTAYTKNFIFKNDLKTLKSHGKSHGYFSKIHL